jgi:hypothetical protein
VRNTPMRNHVGQMRVASKCVGDKYHATPPVTAEGIGADGKTLTLPGALFV